MFLGFLSGSMGSQDQATASVGYHESEVSEFGVACSQPYLKPIYDEVFSAFRRGLPKGFIRIVL